MITQLSTGTCILGPETKLYRYMKSCTFLRLLEGKISMSRMSTWDDRLECADFAFFVNAQKLQDSRRRQGFFASCWTTEALDREQFRDNEAFLLAQEEINADGSSSMWEAYCSNGGVRICTTIGKLDKVFTSGPFEGKQLYSGPIEYCASSDTRRILGKSRLEETLFYKRVGYRHEREYRYVTYLNIVENFPCAIIPDVFDFLDEVLVFPLKNDRMDNLANELHSSAVDISVKGAKSRGTNRKNGGPFCRISQLYGVVSEEIGNVRFVESDYSDV